MRESLAELAESYDDAIERGDTVLMGRTYPRLVTALNLAGAVIPQTGFRSGDRLFWVIPGPIHPTLHVAPVTVRPEGVIFERYAVLIRRSDN